MNHQKAWKSYRKIATQTATSGQLILMLYDGAIRFLEKAQTGFEMEDPAEFNQTIHNNITRTQEIIAELIVSLNMKDGGELALHLKGLYEYMDARLQESNVRKEMDGITDVLKRLAILRDAWAVMLQTQGAANPAAAMAAVA
jgi:flagellar secretion chaperone FliS